MNLKQVVRKAAFENGITGVLAMSKHCGLPYPRCRRVWEGDTQGKVADFEIVLKSLGKKLAVVDDVSIGEN